MIFVLHFIKEDIWVAITDTQLAFYVIFLRFIDTLSAFEI